MARCRACVAWFQGLNPVVVGIFAVAVYRLGRAAITDVPQGVLALAGALALGLTPVGIVPLLVLAGALGVVLYGSWPWGLVATTMVAAVQGVLLWRPPWLPLPGLPAWAASASSTPHPPGLGQIGVFLDLREGTCDEPSFGGRVGFPLCRP